VFILVNGTENSVLISGTLTQTNVNPYRTDLSSVIIGTAVTSIGASAFFNCTRLTTVTIGSGLDTIGSSVFTGCTSLNQFIVDPNNNSFSTLAGGLALSNKSQTNLIQYALGNPTNTYIIPDSVTTIGQQAFQSCQNLVTVTIPGSGVTTIGQFAFYFCQNLATVSIGSGVTTIGQYAFDSCQNLATVSIGSGVTTINYGAFRECRELASMTFNSPLTLANINILMFHFIEPNSTRTFYFYNTSTESQINTNLLTAIRSIVDNDTVSATGPQIFIDTTTTEITVPSYTKTYGDAPFYLDPSSNSPAPFTYFSNNDSVAEVDYYSGLVTLVNNGTARITVSQLAIPGYTSGTAYSFITVNPFTPDNPVIIETGEELEYFLTTNASYAVLENNITIQDKLINNSHNNVYKTIINPTNELINITIEQ
jgi:hypothetical protein